MKKKQIEKKASFDFENFLLGTFVIEESSHNYFQYLLVLISEIQILAPLFHYSFHFFEDINDHHIDFIDPVTHFFIVGQIIDSEETDFFDGSFFMIMIVLYYLGILVLYLMTFHATVSQREKKRKFLMRLLANIAFFGQQLLFVPILACLVRMVIDYSKRNMYTFGGYQETASLVIVILLLIVHSSYTLISSLYNINPFHNINYLGCQSSWHYSLNTVHRIIMMFIFVQDPTPIVRWVNIIANIIITSLRVWEIAPFYNYAVLKVRCGFLSVQISATIFNLFLGMFEESFLSVPYFIIINSFLAYTLLIKHLDQKLFGEPNTSSFNSTHHEKIFYRYIGLSHILRKGITFNLEQEQTKSIEEVYYLGLLNQHSNKCSTKDCLCKFFNIQSHLSLNAANLGKKALEFNFKIRKNFFEEAYSNKSYKVWMKILLCQLILETQPGQYLTALSTVSGINMRIVGRMQRYMIFILRERIVAQMESIHSKEKLDVKNYLLFNVHLSNFNSLIIKTSQKLIDFWDFFKQSHPNILNLIKVSRQCEEISQKVYKVWNKMKSDCSYFSIDQSLTMAIFCFLLRNDAKMSGKITKERERVIVRYYSVFETVKKIAYKTLLDPKNIFIRLSMAKDSLGTILHVSSNIEEIYGYKVTSLVGRSLDPIIPKYLRARHIEALQEQLRNGGTSRLDRNIMVYGENNNGYIVPQNLYISPFPDEKYEFSYLGILRITEDKIERIILLENGKIGGSTEGIAHELGIDPKNLDEWNIFYVCRNLERYHKILNLFTFLESQNIDSPTWIREKMDQSNSIGPIEHDNYEDHIRAKEIPLPFSLFPKKIPHLIIPQTEDEFYSMLQIYKNIFLRGIEAEFVLGNSRKNLNYKITFNYDYLADNSVVKYLSLEKIEAQTSRNFSIGEESNIIDLIPNESEASENIIINDQDEILKAYTHHKEFFKDFNNKTAKDINHRSPSKRTTKSFFLSPKKLTIGQTAQSIKDEKNTKNLVIHQRFSSENFLGSNSQEYFAKDMKHNKKSNKPAKQENSLLKEFTAKNQKVEVHNTGASVSGSRASKSSFDSSQIQAAIGVDNEPLTRRLVYSIIYVYLFCAMALHVGSYFWAERDILQIIDTIDIRNYSSYRRYDLLNLIREFSQFNLTLYDILPNNYAEETNFKERLYEGIRTTQGLLAESNNLVRQNIYKIDFFLLILYYEDKGIKVISEVDLNEEHIMLNEMDLINYLISTIDEMLAEDLSEIDRDAHEISFILENSVNDLLVKIDQEYDILQMHFDFCFWEIYDFLEQVIAALATVIGLHFIFYCYQEYLARKKRTFFLTSFLRIEEKEADIHLKHVKEFYRAFEVYPDYKEKYLNKGNSEQKKFRELKKENIKLIKTGNFASIDMRLAKRSSIIFTLASITIILYIILYTIISKFEKAFNIHHESLTTLDHYLLNFNLMFGGIYQYVSTNGTSLLRGLPVYETMDNELSYMKNNQEQISTLFDSSYLDIPKSRAILIENLCNMFADDLEKCLKYDKRAASKGLAFLNAYLLSSIQDAKTYYDHSDKSHQAVINALTSEDMINSKVQYDTVYRKIYTTINDEFINDMLVVVDRYYNLLNSLMFLFIFFCLSFGLFVYYFVMRDSIGETKDVKLLLRMVPMKTILGNKILYNHLFNSSHSILGDISKVRN